VFNNLHMSSMVNCDDNKKIKTWYNYKELGCEAKYNKTNCKTKVKHNLKSIPQFNKKKTRRGLGFGNQDLACAIDPRNWW
jgi:hypothetical protein